MVFKLENFHSLRTSAAMEDDMYLDEDAKRRKAIMDTKFQLTMQMYTMLDACWDKCMRGSFGRSLSNSERKCFRNCALRRGELSIFLNEAFIREEEQRYRQQFPDAGPESDMEREEDRF